MDETTTTSTPYERRVDMTLAFGKGLIMGVMIATLTVVLSFLLVAFLVSKGENK